MTFNKNNLFKFCMSSRVFSLRILFIPASLLFATSTVNLQSCPAHSETCQSSSVSNTFAFNVILYFLELRLYLSAHLTSFLYFLKF